MLSVSITVSDEKGEILHEAEIECERFQEEHKLKPTDRYIYTVFVQDEKSDSLKANTVQGGT